MFYTTAVVIEIILNQCFFSSTVRGPRALEAFNKSMRSPPPLLGADIGFGVGFAFCVSRRDGGIKRDGVVLRILAWL